MKTVRIAFFLNFVGLLATGSVASVAVAQSPGSPEPRPVSQDEISSTAAKLGELLKENYVYPEMGEQMAADIAKRLAAGEYSQISDDVQFAGKLTQDLRAISHDKHLGVLIVPPRPSTASASLTPPGGPGGPGASDDAPAKPNRPQRPMLAEGY